MLLWGSQRVRNAAKNKPQRSERRYDGSNGSNGHTNSGEVNQHSKHNTCSFFIDDNHHNDGHRYLDNSYHFCYPFSHNEYYHFFDKYY
jgi:hypothetical protein